uniref:Uncharacterized protein n=1 Tax=Anopheles stephensi TaxID=30069 RepID=A0A182XWV0_ANOST
MSAFSTLAFSAAEITNLLPLTAVIVCIGATIMFLIKAFAESRREIKSQMGEAFLVEVLAPPSSREQSFHD